jgi:hypothetical protein
MGEVVLDLFWFQIPGRKADHLWLCLASVNAVDYVLGISGCGSRRFPQILKRSGRRCPNCVGVLNTWVKAVKESGSRVEYDSGEYGPSMTVYPDGYVAEALISVWEKAWTQSFS